MAADALKIKELYAKKPQDYYARQMRAKGIRSAWFRKRQMITRELIKEHSSGNMVLDLGCGNCLWNVNGIKTVGIDICEAMLKNNIKALKYFYPVNSDIFRALPVKTGSVDTVVLTEVLEHTRSYGLLIDEIERVLKPGGTVILSVPYGKFPGIWSLVFPLWCLIKGSLDNDEYYLNNCGHVASFNMKKIRAAFRGFKIIRQFNFCMLNIFLIARKQ